MSKIMKTSNTTRIDSSRAAQSPITVRLQPSSRSRKAKKTKRGGQVNSGGRMAVALPRSYFTTSDTLCLQLKTTYALQNGADTAGVCSKAIALFPGTISTTNYRALGDLFPVLLGLRGSYARFMVSHLKVTVLCTSAYTAGGFIAANFEADSTGVSGPPSNMGDVTNALHSTVSTPGDSKSYSCVVADYFNDWRNSTQAADDPADIVDAGLIQVYGMNSQGAGANVGLVTIEVDFYFSGYRSIG